MFDILQMFSNYEDRKIAGYESGKGEKRVFVSTVEVTDSTEPFETAVAHPLYNNRKLIIVETYDTREEALVGHDKWIKTITQKKDKLPTYLRDVSTASIKRLGQAAGAFPKYEKFEKGDKA